MTQRKKVFDLVDLLLSSVSKDKNSGLFASFLFGEPGVPDSQKNLGIEVYFDIDKLNKSALKLRDIGPHYYNYVDVQKIRGHLQDFLKENFWYIAEDVFLSEEIVSFDKIVAYENKNQMVNAAITSRIFNPEKFIFLYPIYTVKILKPNQFNSFFLSDPQSLSCFVSGHFPVSELDGSTFPPLIGGKFRKEKPVSWIGVLAPFEEIADRKVSVILGSVSLLYSLDRRNLKSGRHVSGGRCRLGNGYTFSFGSAHTPANLDDVEIGTKDTNWLTRLDKLLQNGEKIDRRNQRALQYFYRAWGLPKSERFSILCINLDSIFSESSGHKKSITEGVLACLGNEIERKKIESILDIRASVIHGGAPDVYDTRKYAQHFWKYGSDPILDLEYVVQEALKRRVFSGFI